MPAQAPARAPVVGDARLRGDARPAEHQHPAGAQRIDDRSRIRAARWEVLGRGPAQRGAHTHAASVRNLPPAPASAVDAAALAHVTALEEARAQVLRQVVEMPRHSGRIAGARASLEIIEGGLNCEYEDVTQCPNYRRAIAERVGSPVPADGPARCGEPPAPRDDRTMAPRPRSRPP
ncbi:hypothetical protein GCM10010246_07460 [Streptomyces cuspidosporus]|uniref:Uncharacterized protein n=1 Tax=Streptomyces cuspidosporus TaxID=66882 RepID=A0ABP5SBM7_9ACTN